MNPACWRVSIPGVRATEEDIERLKHNIPGDLQLYIGKLKARQGFDEKGLYYDISFIVNGPKLREDEVKAWFRSAGLTFRKLLPEDLDSPEQA